MEQKIEINTLKELFNWIKSNNQCSVTESGDDFFRITTSYNTNIFVDIEENDEIQDIICRTIEKLNDFDVDEYFIDEWDNKFSPSQFIRMLQEDEETFQELAGKLRILTN